MSSTLALSKLENDEGLSVYLAIADRAVSSVLLREDENKDHRPIYYVNKALSRAELKYSKLEKTAFALFMIAKKLPVYFHTHPVQVLTDLPIGVVLQNPTSSRRLIKWSMMLTLSIEYRPRKAIKEQALADFIVECMAQPTKPSQL